MDGVVCSCGTKIDESTIRLDFKQVPLPVVESIARDLQSLGCEVEYLDGGEEDFVSPDSVLVVRGDHGRFSDFPAGPSRHLDKDCSRAFLNGFLLPRFYTALSAEGNGLANLALKDRIRVRVRAVDCDSGILDALKTNGIDFRSIHDGCIEIDPKHYGEEPFSEYVQAFNDDSEIELGGSGGSSTPRHSPPRKITLTAVDYRRFPPAGVVHLAGKAKFNNKLRPYERKALFQIAQRVLRDLPITEKQSVFLGELLGKAISEGLIEDPCSRGDSCALCREMQKIRR
jgi:hypothetical protein